MDKRRVFADLHLHSSASDGLLSPSELVEKVRGVGLRAMSLTDHDTTDGLKEAQQSAEKQGIIMISGIELSTVMESKEAHFLGYNFRLENKEFQRELQLFRFSREKRLTAMIGKLNRLGIVISRERICKLAGAGAMGRPHLARAMVEAGYADNVADAFDRYLGRGKPAYVERYRLAPAHAVELIRNSGGMAVMAHPGLADMDEYIPAFIKAGLQGLEAFHPAHTPEQVKRYIDTSERYGLIVTGGSDWHGDTCAYHAADCAWGLDRQRFNVLADYLGRNR
ncbi:MAG: PHP domain-containing protein [bacterium]|jgi:predicted metal-dependent phosphoesterase TrpH|nr:PHP domain-containing protein [bacterium]